MDKKLSKLLIEKSLTNNRLDNKKILTIADQLTRKQLKSYIVGIKRWSRMNTVTVQTARAVSEDLKREIRAQYPEKQVAFAILPELIVGMRIIDNDTIYERNLKNTLLDIQQYVSQE